MKIRDIIHKPREALQAMVDGLLSQDMRKDFEIDMNTYGLVDEAICMGCAATCAVQQITGKDITCERFTVDTCDTIKHEAQALGLSQDKASLDDLRKFEQAIDRARRGQLVTLFDYFHIEPELINLPEETYRIRDDIGIIIEIKTDNWKQQIHYVMKKVKELKELGY